VLQESVLRL